MLFAVVLVAGLMIAKWLPYGHRAASLSVTHQWPGGSSGPQPSTGRSPSLAAGWEFLVSYGKAVWLALVAAVAVAAAIEALLPRRWLLRGLGHGPWAGALFALPCMMCTCCTAPIVTSLRRTGATVPSAVAYWLGNPVLNPAVLVFLALVGPWQWAVTRVSAGIALVLGAAFAVFRFVKDRDPVTAGEPVTDSGGAGARLLRALTRFSLLLVPEYAVVVFAVGALRPWLFPLSADRTTTVAAGLVIATVLGLLMVIPTGGEIPIVLGLNAAGASPAIIGVLLITLPAVSLPSMIMVGRALTWRATTAVAGFAGIAGLGAGALLSVLAP